MSASPTIILHTNASALALKLLQETHPGLAVHPCDSYSAVAALIERTQAEIIYSVRFDGTPRFCSSSPR